MLTYRPLMIQRVLNHRIMEALWLDGRHSCFLDWHYAGALISRLRQVQAMPVAMSLSVAVDYFFLIGHNLSFMPAVIFEGIILE